MVHVKGHMTCEGDWVSKIGEIQKLVQDGLYYLTEHANDESAMEEIDIYDVEYAIMTGRIRRSWPSEGKYEVLGKTLDGRPIGIVCRMTLRGKVRVITVYEDRNWKWKKGLLVWDFGKVNVVNIVTG